MSATELLSPELTQILLAIIGAVVALGIPYFTYQQVRLQANLAVNTEATKQTHEAVLAVAKNVEKTEISINSKMDETLKSVRKASLAEGVLQGIETERARRTLEDMNIEIGRKKERVSQFAESRNVKVTTESHSVKEGKDE
jgi:hypothetical protein